MAKALQLGSTGETMPSLPRRRNQTPRGQTGAPKVLAPWAGLLGMLCLAVAAMLPATRAVAEESGERVADRLVVSINALSYTQRQVEAYISLREVLRPQADSPIARGQETAVVSGNWREALAAFVEDMVILQETQRLGSFQTEGQLASRFEAQVSERLRTGKALAATLRRLGVDAKARSRFIDMALRVALFRKNKERQALGIAGVVDGERSGIGKPQLKDAAKVEQWLADLKQHAVVRYYQGAENFIAIEPPKGEGEHGK